MQLILNADDFGFSPDTVAATIECFERGALTSATLMANMPDTVSAIAYASAHPQFSFGAHLTFCGDGIERPLTDPRRIPSLVGENGAFATTKAIVHRAILGRLPVDHIITEMSAQLAFFRDHGLRLSHVDSHAHVHKLRPFVTALRSVLPQFGLRRVRRGQNAWLRKPYRSPTYWTRGLLHPNIGTHFQTTDRFFMPTCPADVESLGSVLVTAGADSLEIGVHPGYGEGWRDLERRAIQQLRADSRITNHRLVTWNDL